MGHGFESRWNHLVHIRARITSLSYMNKTLREGALDCLWYVHRSRQFFSSWAVIKKSYQTRPFGSQVLTRSYDETDLSLRNM